MSRSKLERIDLREYALQIKRRLPFVRSLLNLKAIASVSTPGIHRLRFHPPAGASECTHLRERPHTLSSSAVRRNENLSVGRATSDEFIFQIRTRTRRIFQQSATFIHGVQMIGIPR
jgi:hypothetical protein